jgi:S-adenosyl methyltransferase
MEEGTDWSWTNEHTGHVPPPLDLTRASIARMYDYALGGKDNFAVDRGAAERFFALVPDVRDLARANRAFLAQAVAAMAEAGIEQFLDLGTGIPTSPNVHETARRTHPQARVVCVDNDPVVLAHTRALLCGDPRLLVVDEDLRRPDQVLDAPGVAGMLDLTRPVGLLMIAVLHFVDLQAGAPIVARYLDRLPPGSMLAVTTLSSDGVDGALLAGYQRVYQDATGTPLVARTRGQVIALLDDAEILSLKDIYRSPRIALTGALARSQ